LVRVIKTVISAEATRKATLVLKFVGLIVLGTLSLVGWTVKLLLLLLRILGVIGLIRRVAAHLVTWHPFVAAVVAIVFRVTIRRALIEIPTSPLLLAIVVAWRIELASIIKLSHAVIGSIIGTLRARRTLGTLAILLRVVRPILLLWVLLSSVKILIVLRPTITVEVAVPPLRHLLRASRVEVVIWCPMRVLPAVVRALVGSIVVRTTLRPTEVLLSIVVLMLLVSLKVLLFTAIGHSTSKLVELGWSIVPMFVELRFLLREAGISIVLITTVRRQRKRIKEPFLIGPEDFFLRVVVFVLHLAASLLLSLLFNLDVDPLRLI